MTSNPPDLRPDLAPKPTFGVAPRPDQPTLGMVSLGCPKALVDSERILTRLRAEGYGISADYAGADAVIVNTCGFLDSAKAESLEAIGEALKENGKVIVTGCLGAEPDYIREHHPRILAVTGPHQYEQVLDAVHQAVPPSPDPFVDLLPATGVSLTPRHFSYLKISEGCNHKCKFCIIPDMRGKLASRPGHAVLREAEKLVGAGVRELLVISQDTSAYGLDRKYDVNPWKDGEIRSHITDLSRALGELAPADELWIRLHYVYPYPHVRELIPLMADPNNAVLPYLDIPFQHAHPDVLRRMARPAAAATVVSQPAHVGPAPVGVGLRHGPLDIRIAAERGGIRGPDERGGGGRSDRMACRNRSEGPGATVRNDRVHPAGRRRLGTSAGRNGGHRLRDGPLRQCARNLPHRARRRGAGVVPRGPGGTPHQARVDGLSALRRHPGPDRRGDEPTVYVASAGGAR